MVVPVPTFLEREQIHVGDKALIDHLDAYTAPRLVEYFDENPCAAASGSDRCEWRPRRAGRRVRHAPARRAPRASASRIEAQYTVGEYDILILSATQSGGLETWLRENGYRIPAGAVATCWPATSGRTCASSSPR